MERTLIHELLVWKEKENRKPLILKGVRQCGKTYLLKDFGNRYYDNVAYFNFEETDSLISVFEKDYDTKRIILELELFLGKAIKPGSTLIILDEIQECGRAITAMKYFCENIIWKDHNSIIKYLHTIIIKLTSISNLVFSFC